MANYEATKYDFSGSSLTGIQGVNTGLVIPWSSASVPDGFLECNGAAVSQATYAALFAVIGTTYGDPGGGNFNLPDLTDRTIVHQSPTKVLASTGGANSETVAGNIGGSLGNTTLSAPTIASHNHQYNMINSGGGGGNTPGSGPMSNSQSGPVIQDAGGGGAHSHPISATFTGGSKSILQPFLTVMYIIKT